MALFDPNIEIAYMPRVLVDQECKICHQKLTIRRWNGGCCVLRCDNWRCLIFARPVPTELWLTSTGEVLPCKPLPPAVVEVLEGEKKPLSAAAACKTKKKRSYPKKKPKKAPVVTVGGFAIIKNQGGGPKK